MELNFLREVDLASLERTSLAPGIARATIPTTDGTSVGLIWHEPHAVRPKHSLPGGVHVLVVAGSAKLDGQPVTGGTYYYLPPGERPEVRAGPEGYVVYYVSGAG